METGRPRKTTWRDVGYGHGFRSAEASSKDNVHDILREPRDCWPCNSLDKTVSLWAVVNLPWGHLRTLFGHCGLNVGVGGREFVLSVRPGQCISVRCTPLGIPVQDLGSLCVMPFWRATACCLMSYFWRTYDSMSYNIAKLIDHVKTKLISGISGLMRNCVC